MTSIATTLVIVVITFVSAYLYVISSFGNAILFHLLWQVCATGDSNICSGNIAEAVLYITISTVCSTTIQTYLCRRYINWPLAWRLAIGQLVGGFFGTLLLFTVTSVWIVRSLGLFFLLVAFQSILREAKLAVDADIAKQMVDTINYEVKETFNPLQGSIVPNLPRDLIASKSVNLEEAAVSTVVYPMIATQAHPISSSSTTSTVNDVYEIDTWHRETFVLAVGTAAGFLGGLFGTGGPPLMLFVTYVRLPKNVSRGTLSLGFCAISFERLLLFFLFPPSGLNVYSDDKVLMYDFIIIATLSSIYLGNVTVKYVSEAHFRRLIMCILSTGSVMMMTSGISIVVQVSLFTASLVLLGLLGFCAYKYYYRSLSVEFSQGGLFQLPQSITVVDSEPQVFHGDSAEL